MNKKVFTILKDKKVKPTAARELVLDVFLKKNFAISLSDIEKVLTWSDKVTIYRTLKTFEKNGIIHQINDGSTSVKYALCSENCEIKNHVDIHPHFHCEKCSKTICLEKQEIKIKNLPKDIVVRDYSLILNGLCSECR